VLRFPSTQRSPFEEMRSGSVRSVLPCCPDYMCSDGTAISDDRWLAKLHDIESAGTSRVTNDLMVTVRVGTYLKTMSAYQGTGFGPAS
jgi:hypothetical protein